MDPNDTTTTTRAARPSNVEVAYDALIRALGFAALEGDFDRNAAFRAAVVAQRDRYLNAGMPHAKKPAKRKPRAARQQVAA